MKKFETIEACFQALGLDFNNLPDVSSFPPEDQAYTLANYILSKVIKAHVGDWVADYADRDQRKYYNWFWVKPDPTNKSGFGFSFTHTDYDDTLTTVGARFCFPTYELAQYVAKQFSQLYLDVHMLTK